VLNILKSITTTQLLTIIPLHQVSTYIYLKELKIRNKANIIVGQLQSNERLQFQGNISYRQAHRLRDAIIDEVNGLEIDCFALFPEYKNRIIKADPRNRVILEIDKESGEFKAFGVAPAATYHAHEHIKDLVGLDACHTKSRFRMMLLIATCLDANNQVLPISWALVPTENTKWWTWFCRFLYSCFPGLTAKDYVFISDREKGIFEGVSAIFPNAFPVHCNQHIADNVQAKFGLVARNTSGK